MSTLNHAVIEFLQQSNIFPLKAAPLKHSFVCTLGKLTLALFYCWLCFVMFLTSVREVGGQGCLKPAGSAGGEGQQDVGGGVGWRLTACLSSECVSSVCNASTGCECFTVHESMLEELQF